MVIFKSPYPEVEIPTDLSLPEFLFERTSRWPDKIAFIDGETGATRTFRQVISDSQRVAAGYASLGLKPGEVMALYSPNTFDWPIAYYGVLLAGGIVTTVNPLYTSHELQRQLQDTGAVMIVTAPDQIERVEQASLGTNLRTTIVFGESSEHESFATLLETEAAPPSLDLNPEDVCLLPSSSGTTGLPKAVILTHQAIVANICQSLGAGLWDEDDILLNALPLYHLAGLGGFIHTGFATGSTIVLLSRYDLELVLRCVEKYRVSATGWVPPILLAMTKDFRVDSYDLSSLKVVVSGAAPVGKELGEIFSDRFRCTLREAFGMTEASPFTFITRVDRIIHGSTGPLIPNTESKIVNTATGDELGYNEQGEIWVRGPQVMKGYLNRPDATAITITPDGWLRTGDIGYADEEGYFYIVDRLKELIKYKAYQVAPAELEDVLKGHPEILDAAVIGSPDEAAGELPKAFVVTESDLSEQEIIDYVAERVAPYKKIRLVEFIDAIPKNPVGQDPPPRTDRARTRRCRGLRGSN